MGGQSLREDVLPVKVRGVDQDRRGPVFLPCERPEEIAAQLMDRGTEPPMNQVAGWKEFGRQVSNGTVPGVRLLGRVPELYPEVAQGLRARGSEPELMGELRGLGLRSKDAGIPPE